MIHVHIVSVGSYVVVLYRVDHFTIHLYNVKKSLNSHLSEYIQQYILWSDILLVLFLLQFYVPTKDCWQVGGFIPTQ